MRIGPKARLTRGGLNVDGRVYGPDEELPLDWRRLRAAEAVALWVLTGEHSSKERSAVREFCARWPEGPQIPPEPAQALAAQGRGEAKRRGDSEYYRQLVARRWGRAGGRQAV